MTFHRFDSRADVTSEQLSSPSSQTRKLIKELDPKRPVKIDAYVSPDVPESYVQTRLDLLSTLRELDSLGGNTVKVVVHATRPLSDEADQAEQQYGITPQQVISRSRGAISREPIYLGVAIQAGLNKVVVPFFDRGIPVEYELVRSICTVVQQERKKVGVLVTDAKLFGSFNMQTFTPTRNELLIDELEKQYDVVQVNADSPIEEDLDVLLAPQPSSLGVEQMKNFVAAVKKGIPTAIFEDPFPAMHLDVPGTSMQRRPQQANPFGGSPPPAPKGNIQELWNLLGVDFAGADVVWQLYNPEPKLRAVSTREWVWLDGGASSDWVFNPEDRVSSQLQEMLFLFPGSVAEKSSSQLKFDPLVKTGDETGTVNANDILRQGFLGQPGGLNPDRRFKRTNRYYTVAARITGKPRADEQLMSDAPAEPTEDSKEAPTSADEAKDDAKADAGEAESADAEKKDDADKEVDEEKEADEEKARPKREGVNVVLVCDTDVFYSEFFTLRAMGDNPDQDFSLNLDNVTFVLNMLDDLAGDERFIEIRSRRPRHRILKRIEDLTEKAREENIAQTAQFAEDFEAEKAKAQSEFDKELEDLQKREKELDPITFAQLVAMKREVLQRRLDAKIMQLKKAFEKKVSASERELNREISRVQDKYKMWAVLLPPIPPLLVGLGVYFNRRAREREGVSKARLR
jgi:ABC-2 type transport system permease protein